MNCKPGDLAILVLEPGSPLRGAAGRIVSLKNEPPFWNGGLWHWRLSEPQTVILTESVLQEARVYLAGNPVAFDNAPDMNLRPIRGSDDQVEAPLGLTSAQLEPA